MSRPESIADVEDRTRSVGTIQMEELADKPALLQAVSTFMAALQKAGGTLEKSYSTVSLKMPKTNDELQTTLEHEQRCWDDMNAKYDAALVSVESIEDGQLSWEQKAVRRWAKEEGRPDPFIVSEIEGLLR